MNSHTHTLPYFFAFTLLLAACAPQGMPVPTLAPTRAATPLSALPATQKPTLTGQFVFTIGDGTLWLLDANGENKRALFTATGDTYGDFPAFSPDGRQVAFISSKVNADGSLAMDLRVIGADGANSRVIATPEYPKIAFSNPSWSPDGSQIYFTQSYIIPPASQHDEIDRVSANGGNPVKVIEDAREPNISADGKKIAFMRSDYTTYLTGLWIADVDGKNAKQLVDNDAFLYITTPRYAPDLQSILFAASGAPRKKLPGAVATRASNAADSCWFAILSACMITRAYAHGLPWDMWLVSVDGQKFQKVTDVGTDNPQPAWSRDGKLIAFFDVNGIWVSDRATRLVHQIYKGGGFGGFDWR